MTSSPAHAQLSEPSVSGRVPTHTRKGKGREGEVEEEGKWISRALYERSSEPRSPTCNSSCYSTQPLNHRPRARPSAPVKTRAKHPKSPRTIPPERAATYLAAMRAAAKGTRA